MRGEEIGRKVRTYVIVFGVALRNWAQGPIVFMMLRVVRQRRGMRKAALLILCALSVLSGSQCYAAYFIHVMKRNDMLFTLMV